MLEEPEKLTLRKCIEFAITAEELGSKFYTRMALKFKDEPEVKELFEQLNRDEQVHHAQFSKLLDSVPDTDEGKVDYEGGQYLRAMAISEFFSTKRGPFHDVDQVKSAADALTHTLNFEKAALAFYQAVRDVLGSSEQLEEIIAAERQHVTQVMKLLTTDAKFRSLQDDWP